MWDLHSRLTTSPHKLGLPVNADEPKVDKIAVAGTGPVRLLLDMLRDFKEDWLNGGTVPVKRFDSSCNTTNLSSLVRPIGTDPVNRLWDRSRVLSRWRERMETGNGPENWLWSRYSALRLVRLDKSGRGPVRELNLRLRILNWSRRPRVESGKVPFKPKDSRTKRMTRAAGEQETPVHWQGVEEAGGKRRRLEGSAEDLKERSAEASGLVRERIGGMERRSNANVSGRMAMRGERRKGLGIVGIEMWSLGGEIGFKVSNLNLSLSLSLSVSQSQTEQRRELVSDRVE
jgi:hypothetical protein